MPVGHNELRLKTAFFSSCKENYIPVVLLHTDLVAYQQCILVRASFDLRDSNFPFLNPELFDLRKIYVLNLKTRRPKKMPYIGKFES